MNFGRNFIKHNGTRLDPPEFCSHISPRGNKMSRNLLRALKITCIPEGEYNPFFVEKNKLGVSLNIYLLNSVTTAGNRRDLTEATPLSHIFIDIIAENCRLPHQPRQETFCTEETLFAAYIKLNFLPNI